MKIMIRNLRIDFQNALRKNKQAYDLHAIYVSFLHGCGLRRPAYQHVLTLMKTQHAVVTEEEKGKEKEKNKDGNSSTKNTENNDDNNDNNKTSEKDDDFYFKEKWKVSGGFDNLFLNYFIRFHAKKQKKRILLSAMHFLQNDAGSLYTVELGQCKSLELTRLLERLLRGSRISPLI